MTSKDYVALYAEKKPRQKARRQEQELQIRMVNEVLEPLSGVFGFWFTHFPAGMKRTKAEAGILKAMGMKPGVADFLILSRCATAHWIEIKPPKGGVLNDNQVEFSEMVRRMGCNWGVATSIAELVNLLEAWGLITDARS